MDIWAFFYVWGLSLLDLDFDIPRLFGEGFD